MQYGRQLAVAGVALILGAALFWWSTDPSTQPDSASPASSAASQPPSPHGSAEAGPEGEPEVAADASAPGAARRPPRVPSSIEVPQERIPPSVRAFDTPEQASDFIEDKVLGLLVAVDPSLSGVALERECSSDGRICTFYGPWPGDDFLKDWLRAISDKRTGIEALDGVRFSTFKPVEEGGEKRLVLRAHAP